VEWLGPNGRALTPTGNIRPADARELITQLETGDEGLRFHSAAELPGLDVIVNWAKKARLVRKQGSRLVPVAKARPVLTDAEALWERAFEAAFDLGDAICRPLWAGGPPSPVRRLFDVIVPDVLAAIYSMDEPVPVARGPDAVREQLEELPRSQREDVVRAVRDSRYPARETLEDFRALVAEPILSASSRPRTVRNAPRRPRPGKRRGR
jgi:hypothetical protein